MKDESFTETNVKQAKRPNNKRNILRILQEPFLQKCNILVLSFNARVCLERGNIAQLKCIALKPKNYKMFLLCFYCEFGCFPGWNGCSKTRKRYKRLENAEMRS